MFLGLREQNQLKPGNLARERMAHTCPGFSTPTVTFIIPIWTNLCTFGHPKNNICF